MPFVFFRNARAFQDRIGIWKCWFLRRGENRSTRRKTSRSRVENQQQTQPTYDAGSGKSYFRVLCHYGLYIFEGKSLVMTLRDPYATYVTFSYIIRWSRWHVSRLSQSSRIIEPTLFEKSFSVAIFKWLLEPYNWQSTICLQQNYLATH